MAEVSGIVRSLSEKQASNGGEYVLIGLEGEDQGYFDWDGHVRAEGVEHGDQVRLEYAGGEYPRVKALEKTGANAGNSKKTGNNGSKVSRDLQIVRMTAIKAAACVLQHRDVSTDELKKEIPAIAEELEQWVLR